MLLQLQWPRRFNGLQVHILSKISVHGDISLNLEIDGNYLVPDYENMVDGAFLQIRIQVYSCLSALCKDFRPTMNSSTQLIVAWRTNVPLAAILQMY